MTGIASRVMAGRLPAVLIVVATMFVSLLLPPVLLLSGAALALVTLRRGPYEGALILGAASVAAFVLGWLLFGHPGPLAGVLPGFWLPVWGLAAVLRATVSLAAAFAVAAGLGWLVVTGFYALLDDPADWWQGWLAELLKPAFEQAGAGGDAVQALDRLIAWVAPLMPGMIAANVVFSALVALLIGRWWQARLYNPGGFRSEFHGLRLGRGLALLTIVTGAAAFASGALWLQCLALPLAVIWLLQGLAVLHGLALLRGWSPWALVLVYVLLLLLLPQAVALLCLLGLIDTWMNLRARAAPPG